MTMKNELQHMAKKLSSTTLDKESVQSSLARSEERNLELCEQVNEAQQEVRRFVVTYSVQIKLTCICIQAGVKMMQSFSTLLNIILCTLIATVILKLF